MKIHVLMHVPFEDAANIGAWAEQRGHTLSYTRLYDGETLPAMETFGMLAVMGGPMNIYEYDKYPWLVAEKTFIKQAIDAGKKVIGVCLGGQLIANVLGGNVIQGTHKEIGWHGISQTPEAGGSLFAELPKEMTVFQWHGDTFAIPPAAVHIAASDVCANQAFQYGDNVLGLQFHMEYSQESIEKMLTHCSDELVEAPYIHNTETIRDGYDNIPIATGWLNTILDTFTQSA
ncbi:MAG: type 1 glutamine amidotransferase [Planctomycetota bacterium]|jgi:GMP synthase (glutamine-hydrolysing)